MASTPEEVSQMFKLALVATISFVPKSELEVIKLDVAIYLFKKIKQHLTSDVSSDSSHSTMSNSGSSLDRVNTRVTTATPFSGINSIDVIELESFCEFLSNQLRRNVGEVEIQKGIAGRTIGRIDGLRRKAAKNPRNIIDPQAVVKNWLSSLENDK